MKFTIATLLVVSATAFVPSVPTFTSTTALNAKIRGPTEKAEVLRNGWDVSWVDTGRLIEITRPEKLR